MLYDTAGYVVKKLVGKLIGGLFVCHYGKSVPPTGHFQRIRANSQKFFGFFHLFFTPVISFHAIQYAPAAYLLQELLKWS